MKETPQLTFCKDDDAQPPSDDFDIDSSHSTDDDESLLVETEDRQPVQSSQSSQSSQASTQPVDTQTVDTQPVLPCEGTQPKRARSHFRAHSQNEGMLPCEGTQPE